MLALNSQKINVSNNVNINKKITEFKKLKKRKLSWH